MRKGGPPKWEEEEGEKRRRGKKESKRMMSKGMKERRAFGVWESERRKEERKGREPSCLAIVSEEEKPAFNISSPSQDWVSLPPPLVFLLLSLLHQVSIHSHIWTERERERVDIVRERKGQKRFKRHEHSVRELETDSKGFHLSHSLPILFPFSSPSNAFHLSLPLSLLRKTWKFFHSSSHTLVLLFSQIHRTSLFLSPSN